ncbi:MAG: cytochrome P460 family protein [Enhygromyxa sp.]
MPSCPRLLALVLAPLLLHACTQEPEPHEYDPDAVLAEALEFETKFERLDAQPKASVHGNMDGYAEFYANEIAAEVFRGIDGSDPNATAKFPRGSILVKNNLGPDMQPLGMLTIMAKFEEGYYRQGNDWFWAMVTTDGEPVMDRIGNGQKIYFCYDCHSQMGSNTDFVIGLAPDELR